MFVPVKSLQYPGRSGDAISEVSPGSTPTPHPYHVTTFPVTSIRLNVTTSGTVGEEVEEGLAVEVGDTEDTPGAEEEEEEEDGVATAPAVTPSVPGRAGSRHRTKSTP